MTTIQDDLDAAIPEAPALPSVEDTVRAGRSALRRRRQGATAALVAGLTVVGVVAATGLVRGAVDDARPPLPADRTDPSPLPTTGETPWVPEQLIRDIPGWWHEQEFDHLVQYDYDGVLLVRP